MIFELFLLTSLSILIPFSFSHPNHCSSTLDCQIGLPIVNISSSLIGCINATCVCRQCLDTTFDNRCVLNPCFILLNNTCHPNHKRRSQNIALFYSIFLTAVGASNFYIELFVPASIQLTITLLTWLIVIIHTCWDLGVYSIVRKNWLKYSHEGPLVSCSFISTFFFLVIVIILAIVIIIWWFIDVISISNGYKRDSNNCLLL